MTRDADMTVFEVRAPAAAAGTVNFVKLNPDRPFRAEGFYWGYESAEANTNNTLDFDISHDNGDLDGTFDVVIFTNTNPNGLLDTGAAGAVFKNRRNAASSGAAAGAASDPADVRVPADAGIRIQIVTAGTGTIPAIFLGLYGHYI